jgi:imidazolonepropionase-like amidohydrolase
MAILGNMEIMKTDDQLGSIRVGKLADMVIVEQNPLEDIMSATSPVKVFEEERCYIGTDACG